MLSLMISADSTTNMMHTFYIDKAIKGNAKLFTRISWCCLLSYFISELWGDGLWACPLSSYSWWGCEYNMYRCWQNYTSNFMGKADVYELLLIGQCFTRASRRCSSYNLLLGSFNMVDLRLWDALTRWHSSRRVFTPPMCMPNIFLDWAHQLMYVHDQLLIVISSSGMLAMLGIGSGSSKLW